MYNDILIGLCILVIAIICIVLYYKRLTNKDTVSYFMGKTIWPKRIKNLFKPEVLKDYEVEMDVDTDSMVAYLNSLVKRELKSPKMIAELTSLGMFGLTSFNDKATDVEFSLDLHRSVTIIDEIKRDARYRKLLLKINNAVSTHQGLHTLTRLERCYVLASLFKKLNDIEMPSRNPVLGNTFLRRVEKTLSTDKLSRLKVVVAFLTRDAEVLAWIDNATEFPNSYETKPDFYSKLMYYQLAAIYSNWL